MQLSVRATYSASITDRITMSRRGAIQRGLWSESTLMVARAITVLRATAATRRGVAHGPKMHRGNSRGRPSSQTFATTWPHWDSQTLHQDQQPSTYSILSRQKSNDIGCGPACIVDLPRRCLVHDARQVDMVQASGKQGRSEHRVSIQFQYCQI